MTTWLVSRHPGAFAWLARRGYSVGRRVAHLDPERVRSGDVVIGTLPVPLVAAIVARGARYYHLTVPVPAQLRGRELSAADLERLGARLERYVAFPVASRRPPVVTSDS